MSIIKKILGISDGTNAADPAPDSTASATVADGTAVTAPAASPTPASPDVFEKEPEPASETAATPAPEAVTPPAAEQLPQPLADNVKVRSIAETFLAIANFGNELDAKAAEHREIAVRARNNGRLREAEQIEKIAQLYQEHADRLHKIFTGS